MKERGGEGEGERGGRGGERKEGKKEKKGEGREGGFDIRTSALTYSILARIFAELLGYTCISDLHDPCQVWQAVVLACSIRLAVLPTPHNGS